MKCISRTKVGNIAMRSSIATAVCFWPLLIGSIPAVGAGPKPPSEINVGFRFEEDVTTLHEPVVLMFEVHNGLKQPISLTVGSLTRQFYDLRLVTPSGQVFRKDPFNGQVDIVTVGDGRVIVGPGASFKEPLVMNQWFSFEETGTYSLAATLTSEIETPNGNFQYAGQTVQVLVISRDPAKLNKVCADLEQQEEVVSTVEAAQFSALALSYVDDVVAVPYLARLLSAHTLAYSKAIPGLERIGNDEAVEVLLSQLDENYGDIAELAAFSLARMQGQIGNPRLKETVRRAVERSMEQASNENIKRQIAYLDYRSPQLQELAIQNLMKVEGGVKQAAAVLQRLANDPDQPAAVRSAAKDALEKVRSQP